MRKIYTRTGDDGTTAIRGNMRVKKTDPRIEANGALDELNVAIGTARAFLGTEHEFQPMLKDAQINLMTLMSRVATPSEALHTNGNKVPDDIVAVMELNIDLINATTPRTPSFIVPAGTTRVVFLHQARVAARRAERRLWRLNEDDTLEPLTLKYINRLSDLLFVMARKQAATDGCVEERWISKRRAAETDKKNRAE